MIIDAHTHLGYEHVCEADFTTETLLTNMEKNKIDKSIVQPGTVLDLKTIVKQHNVIADLSKKLPGRIVGMANPNPHLPKKEYCKELKRCVNKLGFVGVKLQTFLHAVDPNLSAGRKVFESALDLEIPVMVHTGTGIPWALPSGLILIAKEFSELKIVLAHAGGPIFSGEASLVAKLCPNIYLETSWLPSTTIRSFCKTIGADRIMFGSDHGSNVATELTKFNTIGLSSKELVQCLGETATKVFKLPIS